MVTQFKSSDLFKLLRLPLIAGALMGLTACAGISVSDVSAPADDETTDGLRYYETAPFVLVYADGLGGLHSEMLYLPDTTRKKAIDPFAFVSRNTSSLAFSNGTLAPTDMLLTPADLPQSILNVAENAARHAFRDVARRAPKGPNGERAVPPPALFRIVVKPDGSIGLVGGYARGPHNGQSGNVQVMMREPAEGETGS